MATATARILGTHVPARFPKRGDVTAIIYGEAPGPLGADKSGIPFWGDRSGKLVYQALVEAGRCTVPVEFGELPWDGAALAEEGYEPTMVSTAVSNAYPVCPTDDGRKFRAPKKDELRDPENVARVEGELKKARKRGLQTVIVLGRHADWLLGLHLGLREQTEIEYHQITHPSPLGLLWLKRQAGEGTRMADVQKQWMRRFLAMLPDR